VEGSLAMTNLVAYVIDEDLQDSRITTIRTMKQHPVAARYWRVLAWSGRNATRISAITPWINFHSQTMDLARGGNGYFYVNDYRGVGSTAAEFTCWTPTARRFGIPSAPRDVS